MHIRPEDNECEKPEVKRVPINFLCKCVYAGDTHWVNMHVTLGHTKLITCFCFPCGSLVCTSYKISASPGGHSFAPHTKLTGQSLQFDALYLKAESEVTIVAPASEKCIVS